MQTTKCDHRQGEHYARLHTIWGSMKTRCNNPNAAKYALYGGRGIKICEEWQTCGPFCEWALSNGYKDTLSLDRVDVNGDYCPENCRWVTHQEQCNNKRNNRLLTYNGETHTVSEWAKKLNMSYNAIYIRVTQLGWDAEKALTTPVKERKR